ncbi:MAG: GNAT family N-acetyltransferase, partial [Asticcacaulis sp.]
MITQIRDHQTDRFRDATLTARTDAQSANTQSPSTQSIETTRLSLNALRASDITAFTAVFADKHAARMTHTLPHPLEPYGAEVLLARMMQTPFTHLAIRTGDETLVGMISLTEAICGADDRLHSFGPNLSVFITPAEQGQGYALEAVNGLLRWCKKRKLHRIIHAAHFSDNEASARVLIAADFLYTGRRTTGTSLARDGEHQI